ncbi:hypothetical protein [Pyrodictium abyssi]|uniref:Tellurite-resistance/dicarboxylate transporter n=1 Tax=Pyrodictium abyssi TaxID=54256 RepID=A0ABN6ZW26_9CREN|nr:tellurite-resistance/dicarboxylate transporter [Pyrodictium abyssi]
MAGLGERIRGMSVAWFSFNLATSAIVLASHALGSAAGIDALHSLARALAYINTAIYFIIAAAFLAKTVIAGREVLLALRHPVKGPFMTAISISTMLLALDWGAVLGNPGVGAAFFYAGMVLHTLLFIVIIYNFLMHEGIEIHSMNPGWYMPAVGNVLVPYVGGLLEAKGVAIPHSLLGVYLGTGVVFWLALFTIWLYRSVFHNPPPARLLAATWINLAPPAVAPMSYEALLGLMPHQYHEALGRLTHEAPTVAGYLGAFFDMFYYTFWGLAGLLLPLILAVTVTYLRRGMMEFAESWWAFVFPIAAYSISTIHLYLHHTGESWLLYYAGFLYALTWLFYSVTTVLSVYYGYREWFGHTPREKMPTLAKPLYEDVVSEEHGGEDKR